LVPFGASLVRQSGSQYGWTSARIWAVNVREETMKKFISIAALALLPVAAAAADRPDWAFPTRPPVPAAAATPDDGEPKWQHEILYPERNRQLQQSARLVSGRASASAGYRGARKRRDGARLHELPPLDRLWAPRKLAARGRARRLSDPPD